MSRHWPFPPAIIWNSVTCRFTAAASAGGISLWRKEIFRLVHVGRGRPSFRSLRGVSSWFWRLTAYRWLSSGVDGRGTVGSGLVARGFRMLTVGGCIRTSSMVAVTGAGSAVGGVVGMSIAPVVVGHKGAGGERWAARKRQ